MNKVKTENIAINAINNEICKYDVLIGNIQKNDKTISLDGNIELYETKKITAENLLGKVPVQVKGKTIKKFSDVSIKHNVKKVDLKNFIQDGKGAIYFVVEILPSNETKIYVHVFTLEDTNKILENIKSDAKTKSIIFQELKSKELIEKVDFLIELVENTNVKLDNIKSFIDSILKYIKSKYQINDKQLMKIQESSYVAFKKGKLGMPSVKLKEVLDLPIFEYKENEICFIFKSIHIYLALNELIKRDDDLLKVIYKFFDLENDYFLSQMQNIFTMYELIDKEKFRVKIAKPLLEYFIFDIEKSNKINKEEITKRYFEKTKTNICVNKENEYLGGIKKIYEPEWILEHLGINIEEKLNSILSKFKGKMFDKYYNKSLEVYEFDFIEMLKDDKVNKKLKEIGLYDIIFESYNEAKSVLESW